MIFIIIVVILFAKFAITICNIVYLTVSVIVKSFVSLIVTKHNCNEA